MPPQNITQDKVRNFLLTRYASQLETFGYHANEVPDDFDFLLKGIVDSFGILEMISAVEKEFGIEIDMAGLDAEQITILGPLSHYVAAQAAGTVQRSNSTFKSA